MSWWKGDEGVEPSGCIVQVSDWMLSPLGLARLAKDPCTTYAVPIPGRGTLFRGDQRPNIDNCQRWPLDKQHTQGRTTAEPISCSGPMPWVPELLNAIPHP